MTRFTYLSAAALVVTFGLIGCDDSRNNAPNPGTTPPSATSTPMNIDVGMPSTQAAPVTQPAVPTTQRAE